MIGNFFRRLDEHRVDWLDHAAVDVAQGRPLSETQEDELEDWFDSRTAPLRKADRHFWRTVIDELRQLRANGKLAAQGSPV
jgi:hypothetical protein